MNKLNDNLNKTLSINDEDDNKKKKVIKDSVPFFSIIQLDSTHKILICLCVLGFFKEKKICYLNWKGYYDRWLSKGFNFECR